MTVREFYEIMNPNKAYTITFDTHLSVNSYKIIEFHSNSIIDINEGDWYSNTDIFEMYYMDKALQRCYDKLLEICGPKTVTLYKELIETETVELQYYNKLLNCKLFYGHFRQDDYIEIPIDEYEIFKKHNISCSFIYDYNNKHIVDGWAYQRFYEDNDGVFLTFNDMSISANQKYKVAKITGNLNKYQDTFYGLYFIESNAYIPFSEINGDCINVNVIVVEDES